MGLVQKLLLNHHGLAAVLSSNEVTGLVKRKAEAAAKIAIERAPVDTGDYRDSIHVEMEETDRARAMVVASSDHASVVEFKTRNLGNALGAARRAR